MAQYKKISEMTPAVSLDGAESIPVVQSSTNKIATVLQLVATVSGAAWGGVAGGTKNALTLSPAPAITAYAAGQTFTGVIGAASSDAAATLAVSGLAAKNIQINGAALSATVVLEAGKLYRFDYDGTQFQATRLSVDLGTAAVQNLATMATITMAGAINTARGTVAMHATAMDLWSQPNTIDGTGTAVTITAIADAPQAGATRTLYPPAGTIITNNAMFSVEGGANFYVPVKYGLVFEAVTTNTYKVWLLKASISSQAEMEAGTVSAIRSMSPLRVAQAIAAQTGVVNPFAMAVFSVSAGVLTMHRSVGFTTFTRTSTGVFDFTFPARASAAWGSAVNQQRSVSWNDSGTVANLKTTASGRLTFVENAVVTDPTAGITNSSSIILFD